MIRFLKQGISGKLIPVTVLTILAVVNMHGQKVKQIEIINADIIKSDRTLGQGAQKLLGNVKFSHEGAVMSCDSAYFYSKTYSMDAFSRVRIVQGDTLFLNGDKLYYDGNTRIAQVRRNVKLVDDKTVLRTEYLDYNRDTDVAYYLNGGVINDGENELTSDEGYFYTKQEIFHFKDQVVIVNPDYTITSDTLHYNTKSKITYFFGPTEIVGEDNYLYCERGWYDTEKDISLMNRNTYLKREGRTLRGDTLYYERNTGYGRANSNVELFDSAQNVILRGNFGIYYEDDKRAMLTDSALMIKVDGEDSLYVHADTLRSIVDTAGTSGENILLAYYHAKIYRHDIQGMCDSLAYVEKDSTFHMFGSPIIWADENQITASKVELKTRNQELHRLYLRDIALLISREDSIKFNQIRGKGMLGYFRNNDLVRLDVTGNGQTIYYAEDQGEIIGVNQAECSDLIITLVDNKVSKVNYLVQPTGKYYPLDLFPENQRFLDGFSWNQEWRPLKFSDVFVWK